MSIRKKAVNFFKSPAGQRLIVWAIPLVVSFISKRLSKKTAKSKGKKR